MKPSVFLDWFGVIADNQLMTRRWRQVEARLLQQRYGGSLSKWVLVHDRAFRWDLNYWSRHGQKRRASYRSLWRHCEIGWMRRTLTWAGLEPPRSESALFNLDRELTYEVTRRIDASYPHARRTLATLRRAGFRLFLVSGADDTYVEGALEATGLKGFFEETYSPSELNAFKGTRAYWEKVLRMSKSRPEFSTVVDDRTKFLRTPARLGLKAILVSRKPIVKSQFTVLRSIEKLPAVLSPSLKKHPRVRIRG